MWAKGSRRKGGLDSIRPLLHLVGLEWKGRDGNVGRVSEDATQGLRFPSLTAELECERRGRGRRNEEEEVAGCWYYRNPEWRCNL